MTHQPDVKMNLEALINSEKSDWVFNNATQHNLCQLAQATLKSIRESEIRMLEVMGCDSNCGKPHKLGAYRCKRCTALKELKEPRDE